MKRFLTSLAPAVFLPRRRSAVLVLTGLAMLQLATAAAASIELETDAPPPVAPAQTSAASPLATAPQPSTSAAEEAPESPLRWSTNAEYSGGDYRWSLSRGKFDFGLRFEAPARLVLAADSRLEASGPLVQTLPALSLGVRTVEAPAGSWLQRLAGAEAPPSSTSRVGIEWKPAESQLMFLRQGLGIRLSGDDRLTMRLRKGTFGIYMNREF